jgi:hypothetical protein
MKPGREMIVLVEPDCIACVRAVRTAGILRNKGIVTNLVIINRIDEPERCRNYGAVIFPATFIDGRLAFYGEFFVEDVDRLLVQGSFRFG